tara:strand:+ start:1337 stop:2827 length:1491 start_codon:yes stop_codon:yes gene_type:complete
MISSNKNFNFSIKKQLKRTNSKFAKKFIQNLLNNKKKIFVYENNDKYSGENLIKKIFIQSKKFFLNKKKIVILNSKNSTNWVILYITAKLMNKIVFIVHDNLKKELLKKIYKEFSIVGIFQGDEFIINNENNTLKKDQIFKKNTIYDCVFTSGSSGYPKAVCIKESSYIFTSKLLIKKSRQTKKDLELLSMPFSHSFGLARLRVMINNNQPFFISDGLKDFPKVYKKILKYEINGLSLVPSAIEIIKFLLKKNAKLFGSQFKYFEIGSDILSNDNRKWLKNNFLYTNIFHHYGTTEASRSFFVDRGNKDNLSNPSNNVGHVGKGVEFKIKSLKKNKNHNIGEIFIKGPHLAEGYFEINKNIKFIPIGKWFPTQDVGFVNNKELILLGRLNSMINVGGQKVYPEEIEKIVNKLDAIKDSICSSLQDRILKEVPGLIVEKSKNSKILNKNLIIQIKDTLKDLPSYKRPKKIIFINKLPKTQNGKKVRSKKILEKFFKD